MDGETDVGLFEIIIILGAVGLFGYLIYKAFQKLTCCCNPLGSAGNAARSIACTLKTDVTGQICGCSSLAKCVENTVGCKAAADYGITEENKLNSCGGPNWFQQGLNYFLGTSFGVGSGTAAGNASPAPAATKRGWCGCTCQGQPVPATPGYCGCTCG